MKKLLYFLSLLIFLSACKDKEDKEPASTIAPVVGKWMLKETEQTVNGKKVWQPSSAAQPVYVIFRSDGVVLDDDGKANCCGPKELKINGRLFEIKPQTEVPFNINCAAVNCYGCPVLEIDYAGDEIIISSCLGSRTRYVRV